MSYAYGLRVKRRGKLAMSGDSGSGFDDALKSHLVVHGPQPILVSVSSVEAKPVQWLWQEYFPLGKLAVIAGDPGLGKSLITVDMAARLSIGKPMPDGSTPFPLPSSTIFLTAEDAIGDTIRPRLEAAGADIDLVHVLDGIAVPGEPHARSFTLKEHIEQLRLAIAHTDAKMVVIDPLNAHLGDVDAHRDADIRSVLKPLADLAEVEDVAVVVVCHLNKGSGGKAIYRVMGSLGSVAAARIAFAVVKHPEDESRRVMAVIKSNLSDLTP